VPGRKGVVLFRKGREAARLKQTECDGIVDRTDYLLVWITHVPDLQEGSAEHADVLIDLRNICNVLARGTI